MRTAARPRYSLISAAMVAAVVGVVAPAKVAVAAPASPPVSALAVRGTSTQSEVVVSWANPADPSYAGARVVIVPGTVATSDPSDPAATLNQSVAAPVSSITWTGVPGNRYAVSVFSYDTGGEVSAAATATVALPTAVRHLTATVTRGGELAAFYFILPEYADAAVVCWRSYIAPTTPAVARDCSAPANYVLSVPSVLVRERPEYAVFAVDTTTGIYGPGVTSGDGVTPPAIPYLQHQTVEPTRLIISAGVQTYLPNLGVRGTDHFELIWAAGTDTPVGNVSAKRATFAVGHPTGSVAEDVLRSYLVVGLAPDMPYTFAARGVDVEGNVSPWSQPHTAATSSPGAYLLDNSRAHQWRTTRVPLGFPSNIAVESDGTLHAVVHTQPKGTAHVVRSPTGGWRRETLPAVPDVTTTPVSASRTRRGVLAVIDRAYYGGNGCVFLRSASGRWRKIGCMTLPDGSEYDSDVHAVHGLEIDNRDAVHVVYSASVIGGEGSTTRTRIYYASNSSGRWMSRKVATVGDYPLDAVSFTHDPVTDRLVLVLGEPCDGPKSPCFTNARYRMKVAEKPARAVTFGTWSTLYDQPSHQAVVPVAVASYGGRITLAVLRLDLTGKEYGLHNIPRWGTPALLTGTSAATIRSLSPIPGAHIGDTAPSLYAQSRTRVLVGWTHGFDPAAQGVWTTWRLYGDGSRTFSTLRATRRTRSAYDRLKGLAVDAAGNSYLYVARDS
jgi:hypothetical protein